MSGELKIENILMQVRSKLQENGVKLWLTPYYEEGIGPIDDEIEVRLLMRLMRIFRYVEPFVRCNSHFTGNHLLRELKII